MATGKGLRGGPRRDTIARRAEVCPPLPSRSGVGGSAVDKPQSGTDAAETGTANSEWYRRRYHGRVRPRDHALSVGAAIYATTKRRRRTR